MADLRIVNFGDSVEWGQGLLEAEKFDVLVQNALAPRYAASSLTRKAHSGAVIGPLSNGKSADGEVPVARPTILEQCEQFTDSPETVNLVLLNGGINDVDIRVILNPLVPQPIVSASIARFCHDSMLTLLQSVAAKFSSADCRIRVQGYYPILSPQSHFPSVLNLLGAHMIAPPSFMDQNAVINAVIARCQQFYAESTTALQQAVHDAGDVRIGYVDPGFTAANSAFAPQSMLWGLASDVDLSPQDPVAASRHASCDVTFDALDIVNREQCYRASAGHPNPDGARQYAKQILATL